MDGKLSEHQIVLSAKGLIESFKKIKPLILENAGNIKFLNKADGSPITEIDTTVERTVQEYMSKITPKIPVFGEESGYDENNLPATCWVIDPIDGTKSFVDGNPFFTNMGVLIVNNEVIFSVIYNPTTDDLYAAQKGHGAFKNDHQLVLKNTPLPNKAWCKGKHISALDKILGEKQVNCEIAPEGGGYGFTMVAEGSIAGRFQLHSRGGFHDYAPGALLVSEAGGAIIPLLSDNFDYKTKSFVACHPQLGSLVQNHITEIRKLEL